MTNQPSVYLQGNFAPVAEEVTVADLEVTGAVPAALAGRYLRTGPNPFTSDVPEYHWFMGDGMVHGVDLHDGRARSYRNRWVRSPEASARFGESSVPRAEGGWHGGSGNTNVFHHAGAIWAITEGSLPYELTPGLDTVRTHNFGGVMPYGMNAHPKFDPATNELHVVSYGFEPPYLRYHVVDATGQLQRSEEIDLGGPVMVHDMAMTETSIVIFDLPVVFDWDLVAAGRPLPFRWNPDYRARVGIMPRSGTGADTAWVDVEPGYVYHPLNAYDDGGNVVIDLPVHPRAFANDALDPAEGEPSLQRWTIDASAGKVATETIDERGQEFPRADERLAGRRHRYGYALSSASIEDLGGLAGVDAPGSQLYKHDLVAGTTHTHAFPAGQTASEFVFVPAGPSAGEDEGWLLGYVYDAPRGASDLVILDAHDFGSEPVARVHLPVRVPQGFHGNWIPDRAVTG
jgi:carotenoid cleavage oxygenase